MKSPWSRSRKMMHTVPTAPRRGRASTGPTPRCTCAGTGTPASPEPTTAQPLRYHSHEHPLSLCLLGEGTLGIPGGRPGPGHGELPPALSLGRKLAWKSPLRHSSPGFLPELWSDSHPQSHPQDLSNPVRKKLSHVCGEEQGNWCLQGAPNRACH